MSHRPNLITRIFGLFRAKTPDRKPAKAVRKTDLPNAIPTRQAKFQIGQVVRHRLFDFRGVVFDVDPVFSNSEEWYEAIPEEVRPIKDQPYYHLFAENERTHYVAYVSEQNLIPDDNVTMVAHPDIASVFDLTERGYILKSGHSN